MAGPLRVLVLGASGMIGQAIAEAAAHEPSLQLVPASHRDRPGHLKLDYESLDTAAAWVQVLQSHHIDAVVNCVGIWTGSAATFERVQYTVPVALFDACAQRGTRIVHLSALAFSTDSPLPYAATKARADRYLLAHCPNGVVIYPSLVFGSHGNSTRFFLNLAALPVQADLGFPKNLQPVHVSEVARAVLDALLQEHPERAVECVGTHVISVAEYFDALRAGMGFGRAPLRVTVPWACTRWMFAMGERLGLHFVNRQTWLLLEGGTCSNRPNPRARPYEAFAGRADRQQVRETQLYWFTRLGMAFLWLWTAAATQWFWPQRETLSWLDALAPGLGTPFWLSASAALDAVMGAASLLWARKGLWQCQFALVSIYSVGLAFALPSFWAHPFGPLTKNLAVLAALAFLALHESKRSR